MDCACACAVSASWPVRLHGSVVFPHHLLTLIEGRVTCATALLTDFFEELPAARGCRIFEKNLPSCMSPGRTLHSTHFLKCNLRPRVLLRKE